MEICVEGIGIVGGFGSGIEEFSASLTRGSSPMRSATVRDGGNEVEMPAFLADTTRLDAFVPKKALRRIDHYARMALLGSYLALEDASMPDVDPKKLGVVVASGYGASATTFAFLESFIAGSDAFSSPTHFSNSVHNAAAAHISIMLGVTGPCLTVSQFEMSVPSALITAVRWLKEERVEKVLFGSVDEYCDVLGYCWRRFFGVNKERSIEPLLFDRQTAVPGEGAAFFLLSRKEPSEGTYGIVSSVETEYHDRARLPETDRTLFILGADGHRECGQLYDQYITEGMNIASYTALFGSFPTNMAFDMAAACVSLKTNRIYGPPSEIMCPPGLAVAGASGTPGMPDICCLKLGDRGQSGVITLKRK